ncbi:hypothetical protein PHYSODRAFT_255797 [Phytophthora sojae]|uniref:Uncharacterized protein n=1 Tax=Phytophthora sojae (strain P6497) TaxID=1094619 RepID=G4ZEA8_PHYSP|nr:hypothetical protein PHYSODRAFT_255797 [Phytophthora sojae]EGZ17871.1 hypothetical protein PHYSODRAFT_255797 [Phytophthora sojae]|eukprot:XP_009526929.1 hypothetical protein PHYSODRAFT_255797 [Phytophthora sojae]
MEEVQVQVQGDAAFTSFPGEGFRFGSSFWLENQVTKKRWTCEVADVAAFAPTGVVLPWETVLHYVAASLKESAAATDSADQTPTLVREDDDQRLLLEVTIRLGVTGFAWAPKYVFPMTLELRNATPTDVQIKLLTTQVQELQQEVNTLKKLVEDVLRVQAKPEPAAALVEELQQEVKTLKEQMQAVLRDQAESQPAAAVSSSSSPASETPSDVDSPHRQPTPTQSPAAGSTQSPKSLPTPSRKDQVWGDIIGQSCHRLVQVDEYRETRNSDGGVMRRHRQRACKVCSALKGDRRRPFETSFYCEECTEQHKGGMVFLCDKVRHHEADQYQNATCSQIWHVMWKNGEDIPLNGASIRMRKKLKLSSSSEGETAASTAIATPVRRSTREGL